MNSHGNAKESIAGKKYGGLKKNLDKALHLFDNPERSNKEQQENLKKYMDKCIHSIQKKFTPEGKITTLDELIYILNALREEMVQVFIACLSKESKRVDVMKEYIFHFHEKICLFLQDFWNSFYDKIDNLSILRLAN